MNDTAAPNPGPPQTPEAPEKPTKKYLSATQIGMFLRCPRQYMFRYLEGLKIPPSSAMMQSKVHHRTVEENNLQKVKSEEDLPLDYIQEFYAAEFDRSLQSEEVVFGAGEEPGKVKDQGLDITTAHHRFIAPKVHPLLVEEKFLISLGDDFPFDLMGIWDVVEKDGMIADNKAYKRAPSQDDVDRDIQLGIYSLGYRVSQGKIENGLRIDAIIKNKTPKAVQIHTSRTNADCRFLLGLIEDVAKAIQSGTFYPNPTGWACSPRFCGYWFRCMGKAKSSA